MNANYEPMEKKCASSTEEQAHMTFADRSIATYKALMETQDILDSIAVLLSGTANSEPVGGMPECLDANICANQFWAGIVRDRVKSLAMDLGVKDFK